MYKYCKPSKKIMLPFKNQKSAYQLELKHSELTELHCKHDVHALLNIRTVFFNALTRIDSFKLK